MTPPGCEVAVQAVIARVSSSELAARAVIDQVDQTHRRAAALLDTCEPVLQRSVDTAAYASERFGAAQVDSVLAYLEYQPLLRKLEEEYLPPLAGLGAVAPDLKELIAVSRGLNELMGSLPGLGKAKRRVDEELEELQKEADDPDSPRA